jgi:hypothetical protein
MDGFSKPENITFFPIAFSQVALYEDSIEQMEMFIIAF